MRTRWSVLWGWAGTSRKQASNKLTFCERTLEKKTISTFHERPKKKRRKSGAGGTLRDLATALGVVLLPPESTAVTSNVLSTRDVTTARAMLSDMKSETKNKSLL